MIKFSLILPIYNVEKYLSRCISSCLQQDMIESDYEIIAVIDGCTDSSLSIAQKFAKEHDNIIILEKDNGGVSDARNYGINVARGKYIWCIDPDDYIESNILNAIYNQMESRKLDALLIRYRNVDENDKILPYYDVPIRSHNTMVMSGIDLMGKVMATYLMAWIFIYRKKFLIDNNLWYKKGMICCEDNEFAYRTLPKLKRVQLYDKTCYNYLQRDSSLCKTLSLRKYEDICNNIQIANTMYRTDWKDRFDIVSFFHRSCTALTIMAIKEYMKVRSDDYYILLKRTLLTSPPIETLVPFGGIKEKILVYLYNIVGIRIFLFMLKLIIK